MKDEANGILTCGKCDNVRRNEFDMAYCSVSNNIVPHSNFEKRGYLTFFRVPVSCPRSELADVARDKMRRSKEWDHIPVESITESK